MHWLSLLRLKQWIKNLILFLPLFFAGQINDEQRLLNVAVGVVIFCMAASAIYILNDWHDREADRNHPAKSTRPIASGKISSGAALAVGIVLALASTIIAWKLQPVLLVIIATYFGLNLLYSIGLKNIAVLDVSLVGSGFLLRILAGGIAGDVLISKWIVLVSFLLAVFLALAKRREDVILFEKSGEITRKSVMGYNLPYISSAITLMGGVVVVAYMMYAVSPEVVGRWGDQTYLSAIWVILGVLKYLQITLVEGKSGDPVKVLTTNHFMQFLVLCWLITLFVIIYGHSWSI